jgi:hypothetical protein
MKECQEFQIFSPACLAPLERKHEMDRRLVAVTEIVNRPIEWLWPERIPFQAITLLDGPPGTGKSVLTYDLVARLTSGKPLPNCSEAFSPAGVVLLQAEDSISGTVLPNLQAMGEVVPFF